MLDLLTRHPDERFTLSEVARRCRLNKATAHALLTTLSEQGMLLRHPVEKRYSLGPRLVLMGEAARRGYSALDFAGLVLGPLAAETGGLARVLRCTSNELVTAVAAGDASGWDEPPASRRPLVPPYGAAFMAWADNSTVEAWLARATSVEVVGPALEVLPMIRRMGWVATPGRLPTGPDVVTGGPAALVTDVVPTEASADLRALPLVMDLIDADDRVCGGDVESPVFGLSGEVDVVVSVDLGSRAMSGAELRDIGSRVAAAADDLTAAMCGRRPLSRSSAT